MLDSETRLLSREVAGDNFIEDGRCSHIAREWYVIVQEILVVSTIIHGSQGMLMGRKKTW